MIDIVPIKHNKDFDLIPVAETQCEHVKRSGGFMDHPIPESRCKNIAQYIIEGYKLCKQHTGEFLIDYHLHEAKEN